MTAETVVEWMMVGFIAASMTGFIVAMVAAFIALWRL
jgi:hypothetical protein